MQVQIFANFYNGIITSKVWFNIPICHNIIFTHSPVYLYMAYTKHNAVHWWDMKATPCQNKWDVYNTGCQNYDSESDHSSVSLIDSGSASACLTGLSGLSEAPHAIPGRGVRQSRRDRRSRRFQHYGSLPLHYPCSPLISSHSGTVAPGQLKCEVLKEHAALPPCHHEQVRLIYPLAQFFIQILKPKLWVPLSDDIEIYHILCISHTQWNQEIKS